MINRGTYTKAGFTTDVKVVLNLPNYGAAGGRSDTFLNLTSELWIAHSIDLWCREVPVVSLDSIAGSVVLLPQIVPALRNNTPRRPLTLKYRDPFSWDLETLRSMLAAFFCASATTSIPPLEEYTSLPDKVRYPLSCSTADDDCVPTKLHLHSLKRNLPPKFASLLYIASPECVPIL